MNIPMLFTILWLIFCALWGGRSVVARRGKEYFRNKKSVDQNARYKYVSHFVYVCQIVVVVPMFWFDSPFFLRMFKNDLLSGIGFAIVYAGLFLSIFSLIHLGRNYSPCYDSHLPYNLVTTGPYRFIRHPGWLSKILVGIGSLLITGSIWFVPMFVWLLIEMRRTIRIEEEALLSGLPGYREYRERTSTMIPVIY